MPLFDLQKTPKAIETKTQKQAAKICKAEMTVREAFPAITPGMDYPFCSGGDWSTHDLLFRVLDLVGPCSLTASTWSVAEAACHKLIEKMAEGKLTEIKFLVDWRVKVRTPGFMAVAKANFSDVRVGNCHAKVFVLRNEKWAISVVGSANFTSNPRIEAGHMSTSKEVADFHEGWLLAEINKAEPFGCDMNKRGKADGRK